jgi:hypothetical protein
MSLAEKSERSNKMKQSSLLLAVMVVTVLFLALHQAWAACPQDPNDLGICDTLYVETFNGDHIYDATAGYDSVRVAIYVTHDSNTFWYEGANKWVQDSILAFVVPLRWWKVDCADSVVLPKYDQWNNKGFSADSISRSIFRDIVNLHTGDTTYNRMKYLNDRGVGWPNIILDITSGPDSGLFKLALIRGETSMGWWEGSKVLLATMTFLVYMGNNCYSTNICLDSTFWSPANHLCFVKYDATSYTPRQFLPVVDTIYIPPWYWKPSYPDYAPSGMPDFGQRQDNWRNPPDDPLSRYTFCGPCAVANCFWWFDSKYYTPPGGPGDGVDMFPLVRDYLDNNPPLVGFDDHDPWNVNHVNTPWNVAIGAPPFTPQPFVPGPQSPNQVTSWGELVERLAWYFDTDGIQTGYQHAGTNIMQMKQGIDMWLQTETFSDGSSLADTFCVKTWQKPTFAQVESLVEKSENVILLLGFWWFDSTAGQWFRCGGHYVSVAGINSKDLQIGLSDPYYDAAEQGLPGIVGNGQIIPHLYPPPPFHGDTVHNDAGNVSHDIYQAIEPSPTPGGLWALPDYPADCNNFDQQNFPDEFLPMYKLWDGSLPVITEAEYAVEISPWDYRGDVNIPGGDGTVDVSDIVFLLNYLFVHGPTPDPYSEGDVTCDGVIDISDVVFLLNYLFIHGPAPHCCVP